MSRFGKRARREQRKRESLEFVEQIVERQAREHGPRHYGRVNAYTCERCKCVCWTYDRDEGTTLEITYYAECTHCLWRATQTDGSALDDGMRHILKTGHDVMLGAKTPISEELAARMEKLVM